MRKHRLFGVVIALSVGVGAFTHAADTPHRTSGTAGAGIQLASAELAAHHVDVTVSSTTAGGAATTGAATNDAATTDAATNDAAAGALPVVTANGEAVLPFPFEPVALVSDYRAAAAREMAEHAYLSALAQERAAVKAYLATVAPRRAPAAPARPASRPANPWAALRQCESGGNYRADTGNGYYGAYQFTAGSWASLGLHGLPSQASPAQQDQAAQALEARRGWGQWPSCARRLGLI
jgi:hypothetical protein